MSDEMKKSKISPVLIACVIAVIVIAVIASMVFTKEKTPEQVFEGTVQSYLSKATEQDISKYKAVKLDLDADVNIKGYEDNEIVKLVNDIKLSVNAKANTSQVELDVDAKNADEDLINAKGLVDTDKKSLTLNMEELYSKSINFNEILRDEQFESIKEALSEVSKEVPEERVQILENAINEYLIKEEYCTSSKGTVSVDGADKNVTINTYTISAKDLTNNVKEMAKSLKENEAFLATFSDEDKEEMISSLDQLQETIEDAVDEDSVIVINYCVNRNSFVKAEFIAKDGDKEELKVEVTKPAHNTYDIKGTVEGRVVSVKVVLEKESNAKGTATVELNSDDIGNGKLVVGYEFSEDNTIDSKLTEDTVNYTELTGSESQEIAKNLMNSKIYKLIMSLSGGSSYEEDLEE